MEAQTKDLRDYIGAFRRRRNSIFITSAVILAVSVLAALLWPPTYRSTATILIKEQDVPPDLVRSTITSYAAQRIEQIKQQVMTRTNLMQIVEKYNLYLSKRRFETTEEIMERMRTDIKVEMINAEVIDPRSGRATQAVIAFALSYDGEAPEVTQKVASELTTLYLNENLKNRTEKATETTVFLTAETEKLGQYVADLETKIAAFKEKNVDRLPELSQFNMNLIERTERDILDVDNQMRAYEDRKFYLEGQLVTTNPMGPMVSGTGERIQDPVTRLKAARTEYLSVSSKYSADHPDVIRLRREIEGLEKVTGAVDSTIELAKELSRLRTELATAREKYSADHPDVIRLTKVVAAQEDALKQKQAAAPEKSAAIEKPDNPSYVNLKAQVETVNAEIKSLNIKRNELKAKLANIEKKVLSTPEVERRILALKRDYENSVKRYQDIKAKQMGAEVGQELEKERKGERFELIDPPNIPEEPAKPNRPAIIILGFLLSVGGGLGFAAVAEGVDSSVRGVRSATELFNAPPLSVIPYLRNREDMARDEKTRKIVIAAIAGSFVLVILLVHFLWTPLDVLWFKGLRKVDTVIGG